MPCADGTQQTGKAQPSRRDKVTESQGEPHTFT